MAITLIAVGETQPYRIPSDEKADPENATVWQLRILDSLARYRLAQEFWQHAPKETEGVRKFRDARDTLEELKEKKAGVDEVEKAQKAYDIALKELTAEPKTSDPALMQATLDICRFGLAGWSIKDPPFRLVTVEKWGHEYKAVPDDLLLRIPEGHILTLAMAIMSANYLTGSEKKVSESPGQQEGSPTPDTKNSTTTPQASD